MHRVLFTIGSFPVYTYGVMVAMAIFCGYILVMHRNKSMKVAKDEAVSDFFVLLLITGIVGARLLYVLLHFSEYSADPVSIFKLRSGGLALHGALIAGVMTIILFTRVRKIDMPLFLDLFAPSILLGIGIGRLGCFFNGCCGGMEASPPFGVLFYDAGFTTLRYPTQLYEMFLDFAAVFVLLSWEKRIRFQGEVFLGSFFLYSVIRFILECFRESPPRFFGLSIAQYLSIVIFGITLFWIVRARKKENINIFKNVEKSLKKQRY